MAPLVNGNEAATAKDALPKPFGLRPHKMSSTCLGSWARAKSWFDTGGGEWIESGIPNLSHDPRTSAGFDALGEKHSLSATIASAKNTGMVRIEAD